MKIKPIVFFAFASILIHAQEADLSKIKRDIGILTSALKTSLSFDESRGSEIHFEPHAFLEDFRIKGTYLKHQGVLLTIEFSHHGHYLLTDMGDVLLPLGELAIPEVTTIEIMGDEEYEVTMEAMEEALEEAEDVMEDMEDLSQGELRRELAELKRLQREELRRTRERYRESREELYRKKALSEAERAEILKKVEAQKKEIKETTEKYQVKLDEIKAKQRRQWDVKLAKTEQTLVEILCDYGSAMRGLPEDEHITILMINGHMNADGRFQDKIFVFKKEDLTECRDGSIDPQELMQRGQPYPY